MEPDRGCRLAYGYVNDWPSYLCNSTTFLVLFLLQLKTQHLVCICDADNGTATFAYQIADQS